MDKCSYASLPTVVLWQGNRCLFHEVIHFTVLADIIVFSLSPLVFVWTRAVWYVTEVSLHVLQFTILDLNQQNSSLAYPHSLRDLCTKFSLIFSSTAFQMPQCFSLTFCKYPSRIRLRSARTYRDEPLTTRLKFGERCFPMLGLKLKTACPMQFRK